MKFRFFLLLIASLLLSCWCIAVEASVQVRQFFSPRTALLGQPVLWSIKLHHPLSESYSMHLDTPAGLKMEIAGHRILEEAYGISEFYTIRMTPQDLRVDDIPSITITDQRGQSIVLTGKPVNVASISGTSLQIQQPKTPGFEMDARVRKPVFAIAIGSALLFSLMILQYRSRRPRARLLHDLRKSLSEVRRGRLPFFLWSSLRSSMLWGFAAESKTGLELKQAAGADRQLVSVAELIEAMERQRYAGEHVRPTGDSERLLIAAIDRLKRGRKKQ